MFKDKSKWENKTTEGFEDITYYGWFKYLFDWINFIHLTLQVCKHAEIEIYMFTYSTS